MNINTLDLHFQNVVHTIASYLIETAAGPILVETGPGSTLPHLLSLIAQHGYEPGDIQHVFVTHIHLDHAGAAGWWAQQGAQVYVHHFGAKHLIEPFKLWRSASRIYGERMETLWGEMVPAPAEKVTPVFDGDVFPIGNLHFAAMETPGHARHHHVWCVGDVAFTGDAAGIRLPHSALVDVPAPPPEFDKEAWLHTLDRLQQANFSALYPTHFGPLQDVDFQLQTLRALVTEAADFIRLQMDSLSRDELISAYEKWVQSRGLALGISPAALDQYELANPLFMSVDGITRYWRKQAEGNSR